jgi:hypothetical protein
VAERTPTGGLAVIAGALALLVCCGVPWLSAVGGIAMLAGAGLGNWWLAVAGLAVLGIGIWRRGRRQHRRLDNTPVADLEAVR